MSRLIQEHLDVDMRRLRKMLSKVIDGDADSVRKTLQKKDETRVLDIACGACNEAEALTDFLAELQGARGSRVKLTGIDLRAREIADAKSRFGGKHIDRERDVEKEFEFLSGDATKLDGHGELGDDFDLVFMRHQNYWNGSRTWEQIFDQALGKLSDDGSLVITSYFDEEHKLATKALEGLGGELIRSEFNPETRTLPTAGKSVDRHVAVFRKKKR